MRLSTIFISSVFVLAGTSTAFQAERGNMLMARSADSDFISEVYGRAYDEDHKLYARAGSRNNYNRVSRRRRSLYEPPRRVLARSNNGLKPPNYIYDPYARQRKLDELELDPTKGQRQTIKTPSPNTPDIEIGEYHPKTHEISHKSGSTSS